MINKKRVQEALDLVLGDGEWPSPEFEEIPQARRAQAMQRAVRLLCEALLGDPSKKEALHSATGTFEIIPWKDGSVEVRLNYPSAPQQVLVFESVEQYAMFLAGRKAP